MNRVILLGLLPLIACANKEPINAETEADYAWPGGRFDVVTTGVDDPCASGAFSAVLLPEGPGSESDWQYSVEIPSWDDLETPVTYEIQLQAPFAPMDVTVRRGSVSGEVTMSGGVQERIAFDPATFDDCELDMSISADIVLDSETTVHGEATLSIIERYGQTCPQMATPCDLVLRFTGEASVG
jgi:hypothetical protein